MAKDIPNTIRYVIGFNRILDKNNFPVDQVEYDLKPMDLDFLRKLFNVDMNNPDYGIQDIIDPLDINEEQAKALTPYLTKGEFDFVKCFWELHCSAKPLPRPTYTVADLDKAIAIGNSDGIATIFRAVKNNFDNAKDILECYHKTLHINDVKVRRARIGAIGHIIWEGFPIKDDELSKYLKISLDDSDEDLRDWAKEVTRRLKGRNDTLYQKIKSQHNLQYSFETDADYKEDA